MKKQTMIKAIAIMIMILIITIMTAISVYAADAWTKKDLSFQIAYSTVHIIDWMQTKTFVKDGREELNPILGKHPSQNKIDLMIGAGLIAHWTVAHLLPTNYRGRNIRRIWQYVWIGIETTAVVHNYSTGVRLKF